MKTYSFKRPFCYYLHPQISDLMPSLSRDTSTMTGIQGQIQWTRELLIHKFKTMGYYCSHYLSFRQKTQQISLDTSVPFIPIESVGIAKPLGWLESLWSSAMAVRDFSQQSLYERKHHHCTVHDLLDFQIFRSSDLPSTLSRDTRSLDTSIPFIPMESVGLAKPLGWLESLWSSATAVRDVSQQSLYEQKHHHCTVHDLLVTQVLGNCFSVVLKISGNWVVGIIKPW